MRALPIALTAAAMALSCGSSDTGGALIRFHAYAAGPAAVSGTLEFDTGAGFHIQLTSARMHIGAIYLRLGQANPGSANASCVGDTTYGIEVPGGVDVDVLSSRLQEFSVLGSATSDRDQSAEVWLVDGDINAVASTTVVASVEGTASRGGKTYPFAGAITIGENRLIPPTSSAQPGQNPICKQRIITPIPVSLQPTEGGDLVLRIDPRPWLANVDFSSLRTGSDGATYQIPDISTGTDADVPAGRAFFSGVTGASPAVYQFSWFVP